MQGHSKFFLVEISPSGYVYLWEPNEKRINYETQTNSLCCISTIAKCDSKVQPIAEYLKNVCEAVRTKVNHDRS